MNSQSLASHVKPSLRVRCDVLLDYADDLHSVMEPVGDCLEEWERWRQARSVRRHVSEMLALDTL